MEPQGGWREPLTVRRGRASHGAMNPMDKIRLVLVDDHEMVRYGLRCLLEAEADMVVVGEAGTGEDAVRIAHEHHPDVILLDVKLTNMDGPEVCRRVLSVSPDIAVVMLTSYTQEGLVLQSLAAGAKGYIVKDIAERVHLSPHTVKDRLTKIRDKLAVRSRTGIVAEAVKRGLI